jgi:branched-chain amino acid transport system ATP-binding protein
MAGTRMLLLRRAVRGAGAGARAQARRGHGQPEGATASILIAESNEVHVADLLSRAFRIERGAVAPV